jgi:threonine dehydratase
MHRLGYTFADIERAAHPIKDIAHHTPVVTSRSADERTGALFFKCENLAHRAFNSAYHRADFCRRMTGGAVWCLLLGRRAGVRAPDNCSTRRASSSCRRWPRSGSAARGSAEIVLYDRSATTAGDRATPRAERGLADPAMRSSAGGGGRAWRRSDCSTGRSLDVTPCRAGGVSSPDRAVGRGAIANCRVISVEPSAGDDATRSFQTKQLQRAQPADVADGARRRR